MNVQSFDECIAIDWSGAQATRTPSITMACARKGQQAPILLSPDDGGLWSRYLVGQYILTLDASSKRLLIGIDCNFSYADNILRRLFPLIETTHDLWAKIDEYCHYDSNYGGQSFWMHPLFRHHFWCEGKKPKNFTHERRLTEIRCSEKGMGWPEDPFKLIGPKQVGKGGLTGMRLIHHLRRVLKEKIAIWPFDSTDQCDRARLVIVEIYPRLFIQHAGFGMKKMRTSKELNVALKILKSNPVELPSFNDHQIDALISAAGLREWMRHSYTLSHIDQFPSSLEQRVRREGWIFGV